MEEVKAEKPKGKGGIGILLLLMVPVFAIAYRSSGKKEAPPKPVAAPGTDAEAAASILRKVPLEAGGGPAAPAQRLVKDAKEWAGLWDQVTAHRTPASKPPSVDFSKEMVAFAGLGSKPSGGWSIEIVGAREEEGKLRIFYAEKGPAEGAAATAVMTSPWHAVVLARSDLPVEWTKYESPKAK